MIHIRDASHDCQAPPKVRVALRPNLGPANGEIDAVSSSSFFVFFFLLLGFLNRRKNRKLFQSPPTNNNLQLIKSVKHQPTGLVATQIKSLKPLLSNGVRHKTQELLRRGLSEFQPVCIRQPVLHRILCKCSFNQI